MNIDLLLSKQNDVGLVVTGKFDSPVTAAIFDHDTRHMSLEFGQTMDSLPLNIPVADDLIPYLVQKPYLYMIGTDKAVIHEAYRIPLMHVNDVTADLAGEWA